MPTQCSADLFGFAPVEGRRVEAGFDGGTITSDAGALLLGATDRVVGLVGRLAGCFVDARRPDLIEHDVATLIGQRVFGIALGYEDLNDHEHLRHDPAMAVLAGKLVARRSDCAPVAGKSTLNRLELSRPEPTRYHKIAHDEAAIERLFVELFLEAHANPPKQIVLDLDATDDPVHGHQEGRFFHGYYDGYCYLPLYMFCGRHLLPPSSGAPKFCFLRSAINDQPWSHAPRSKSMRVRSALTAQLCAPRGTSACQAGLAAPGQSGAEGAARLAGRHIRGVR